MARIPEGVKPQDTFPVQVPLPQPVAVMVHESATPGDEVIIHAPDGRPRRAKVPEGKTGGDTFMALIDPLPVALPEPLESDELQPWLDAARDFKMNSDFEVPSADVLDKLDFPGLMAAMKTESDGKMTIQALSDKIVLSRLLDNMSMPQMPMLLTIQDAAQVTEEVRRFVDLSMHEDSQELIAKPTHLSNAEGVCTIQGANFQSEHKARLVEFLEAHFGTFMNKKAKEFESQALQSLRPGFVVQPKYKSSIGFHMPLEMRIVTLWGKARMGVWWWGMPGTGMPNQRNTWVVRRPLLKSQLSDDDDWDVVHEHPGRNHGFEKALELFKAHIKQMAKVAEQLATAVGAPFLRTDFFIGDPKWGVRVNEVAYGSGTLHKRPSKKGGMLLVDDAHAMAQILREGMAQCQTKQPAEQFLRDLGVRGSTYQDLSVDVLPGSESHPPMESECEASEEQRVPAELCMTPRAKWMPPGFVTCEDHPQSAGSRRKEHMTIDRKSLEKLNQQSPKKEKEEKENQPAVPAEQADKAFQKPLTTALKKVEKVQKAEMQEEASDGTESWKSMLDNFVSSAPAWIGLQFQKTSQKSSSFQCVSKSRQPCKKPEGSTTPQGQKSWEGAKNDDLL
jgi:hypothetical protein